MGWYNFKGSLVKQFFIILGMALCVAMISFVRITPAIPQELKNVMTIGDLVRLFPNNSRQIKQQTKAYIKAAKKCIKQIKDVPNDERTFANTAKALDNVACLSDLAIFSHAVQLLELLSPDKALRDAAHDALLKIEVALIDMFGDKKLYQGFKVYVQDNAPKEDLTPEQRYYLEKTLKRFQRNGLELPDKEFDQVKELKKELAALALDFERNIATDNRTITVKLEELAGLPDDFIAELKQTDDGDYILGVDYPTYFTVMQQATNSDTRKKLYHAFNNRGHPANEALLKQIIAKRDQLAHMLGFASYAHFDLDDQMVQNPERALAFLDNLIKRADVKEAQEFKELIADLPEGVALTQDGKLEPWDYGFAKDQLKKQQYDIDEEKISEYFPIEETIKGLLSIYELFLSLRFEEVPIHGLWSNNLRMLKVFDKATDKQLGFILLDLYPRANKYSHAAHLTVIPATFDKHGKPNIEVSVIMANFPKARGDKPPLFKREDVKTFFHEFGHAMHALLGRTQIASFAGTSVKTDFVEMPSQMLEEWLWDKEILKMVSGHYQTGESLPDDLIDRMLAIKHISAGSFVQRQDMLSMIALKYFLEGQDKDVKQINKELQQEMIKNVAYAPDANFFASFGHLSGYGAKYYGYLWSRVFGLDLFGEIKKHGLLNPEIGQRYIKEVIGRGGSADPNELLRNFLGREPNDEAFFKDMGL